MSIKIISERHLKPLTSMQRSTLHISSAKEAKEMQQKAIFLFCDSCHNSYLNIAQTVKKFQEMTKKQKMALWEKAMELCSREKYIQTMMSEDTLSSSYLS